MDYKPNEVFVGVVDIFAIILPGALLSLLVTDLARNHIFNGLILPHIQGDAQGWAIFVFSSYFLGHFIFLLGSHLDWLYSLTYRKYKTRKGHKLLDCVMEIKKEQLGTDKLDITNAYKWARVNVEIQNAGASAQIGRLEADSKFFRSLIVILFITCFVLLLKAAWAQLAVGVCLTALSFWRYFEQRWKFTTLTYEYFIALDRMLKQKRMAAGSG
jgi:hypothetical protein